MPDVNAAINDADDANPQCQPWGSSPGAAPKSGALRGPTTPHKMPRRSGVKISASCSRMCRSIRKFRNQCTLSYLIPLSSIISWKLDPCGRAVTCSLPVLQRHRNMHVNVIATA